MLDLANVWLIENKPTNVWEQTNVWIMLEQCLNDVWKMFEQMFEKQTNVWEQTLRKQMLDLGFYQRIDLVTDLLGNDRIGQLGGCWPSGQGECGAWLGLHFTILRGGVLKEREREGVVACVCSKFLQNCKHRDKRKILTKLQTQRQTQNSYKTANTETNAKKCWLGSTSRDVEMLRCRDVESRNVDSGLRVEMPNL